MPLRRPFELAGAVVCRRGCDVARLRVEPPEGDRFASPRVRDFAAGVAFADLRVERLRADPLTFVLTADSDFRLPPDALLRFEPEPPDLSAARSSVADIEP